MKPAANKTAADRPAGPSYSKLIKRLPLRKISNDKELALADAMADELWDRDDLDQDENDYLDALNILIRSYEKAAHPSPAKPMTPREMLLFLLEENGMKQVDLCKLLSIPSGRASEIVSGARELSKLQIAIVADRFCVDAAFFLLKPTQSIASDGNKWGIRSKVKGVYEPADGTMVVSEKHKISMGRPGTKPRTTGATPKRKAKGA
jgi:antitoxin component HigA of HigAB toxin-antitoxin module